MAIIVIGCIFGLVFPLSVTYELKNSKVQLKPVCCKLSDQPSLTAPGHLFMGWQNECCEFCVTIGASTAGILTLLVKGTCC